MIVVIPGLVAMLAHLFLGFGLRRFWKSARWLMIAWTLVVWALTLLWTWHVSPSATIDLVEWPRQVLPLLWPLFVLAALLAPATGRFFVNHDDDRPSVAFSLGSRLFLVVIASGVIVDAVDWVLRRSTR